MSIQNLLKNIFHRTPDPAKIKRKEHEKAKRTYTRENYIKYLCEEENKEFLNEFVYNKKLNILSCKNANKWLKCSNYTSTEKNAYRSLEDKKMLNKRLLYHYYINNWVNCKYVHQTYFPESIPISLNSEIKETLEFIDNRITHFKENYGKDFKYQVDLYNEKHSRIKKYFINDIPVQFYDGADLILYNDKHCEIISYSYTTFNKIPGNEEFNLYALELLSSQNREDDYSITYTFYKPTIKKGKYTHTYLNQASFNTREVLYGDVKKWYKENKYKIMLAAIGDYNYIKGDWCKFCKQKCRYNNGSV